MQHIDRRSYAWQRKKAIVLDCNNQSCHNNHQLTRLIHEIFDDSKRQQVCFRKWFKKTASESMSNIYGKKPKKNIKNIWNYKRKHDVLLLISQSI